MIGGGAETFSVDQPVQVHTRRVKRGRRVSVKAWVYAWVYVGARDDEGAERPGRGVRAIRSHKIADEETYEAIMQLKNTGRDWGKQK